MHHRVWISDSSHQLWAWVPQSINICCRCGQQEQPRGPPAPTSCSSSSTSCDPAWLLNFFPTAAICTFRLLLFCSRLDRSALLFSTLLVEAFRAKATNYTFPQYSILPQPAPTLYLVFLLFATLPIPQPIGCLRHCMSRLPNQVHTKLVRKTTLIHFFPISKIYVPAMLATISSPETEQSTVWCPSLKGCKFFFLLFHYLLSYLSPFNFLLPKANISNQFSVCLMV